MSEKNGEDNGMTFQQMNFDRWFLYPTNETMKMRFAMFKQAIDGANVLDKKTAVQPNEYMIATEPLFHPFVRIIPKYVPGFVVGRPGVEGFIEDMEVCLDAFEKLEKLVKAEAEK